MAIEILKSIEKRLDNYNKVEKSKNYILDIVTKAERIVIANDSKGDPSKYNLEGFNVLSVN